MTGFPHSQRFESAIKRFDELNAGDPHLELVDGKPQPRELTYARRLTDWVLRLDPDASETLRLAARCQHLCRWEIPRTDFTMDRPGYLKWRTQLKKFHAEKSAGVLTDIGYDEATVWKVHALNLKQGLGTDPDCQTLEDALCLVFLEFQLTDLAAKMEDEKLVNALRKSWLKMSERGRAAAMKLEYTDREKALLQAALRPPAE